MNQTVITCSPKARNYNIIPNTYFLSLPKTLIIIPCTVEVGLGVADPSGAVTTHVVADLVVSNGRHDVSRLGGHGRHTAGAYGR